MNVVLVHGAVADGSSWAKVITILQARHYHVTAVQLPLTSLADDVAVTSRALAQQDGPVILVGHSWGDAVVKHFASDLPVLEARVLAATQGPIASSAFSAQVSVAAWNTKPSWYIVSRLDGAIPPDEERFFAKRMNATTTELNTSHVAMLSQPKAVAAVIIDAASTSR